MKKTIILLLCLALVFSIQTAFAAGKLNVEKENFCVISSWGTNGYAFAKVANVGNKPIKINAGILELFDAEGENITSSDSLYKYAEYLQPDEYTYVYMKSSVESEQVELVDDYLLTITGKSENDYLSKRFAVSDLQYVPNVKSGWSTYDYLYATVTNDSEDVLYGITVLLVLLDDKDNILFLDTVSTGSNVAILPGSSIRVKTSVDDGYLKYFEKEGITPTKVDAIAYKNIELE